MTVLVFANGLIEDVDWIRPHLEASRAVLAADGGMRHLLRLGHWPDAVIGDNDSLPDGLAEALAEHGVAIVSYDTDKNETDLELALLYAAERYSDDILVFGAIGGRLDQTLANIMLLAHPDLIDRSVTLMERRQRAWLVDDATRIDGQAGDIVSLVPVGGPVEIRDTTGLRWPLHDEMLSFGPARGISNEMTGDLATVTLTSGLLVCIHGLPEPD